MPFLELRLRYRLGTLRLRTLVAGRNLAGRLRRRPRSARLVPHPRRPRRGERPLRLTHALAASDLNPRYLDFWPLVRRAWAEIVGLEPVLVLVAEPGEVPDRLRDDPAVHVFPPLSGVHTAFQAQCIRLLYPALLSAGEGVLISDADMVPMNRRYFHRPVLGVPRHHFVAYRDVYVASGEIPMCYNAALPETWREVFGVDSVDTVRARLAEWAADIDYAGVHGGAGWLTDQQILHRTLLDHARRTHRVWILDDHYTGFRRLERAVLLKKGRLDERDRRLILRGSYTDFHCVHPYSEFGAINDGAVDLAIEGLRRRRAAQEPDRGRLASTVEL